MDSWKLGCSGIVGLCRKDYTVYTVYSDEFRKISSPFSSSKRYEKSDVRDAKTNCLSEIDVKTADAYQLGDEDINIVAIIQKFILAQIDDYIWIEIFIR